MPLSPRTEKILKRTSLFVSGFVGTANLLIVIFWAWFLVYLPKADSLGW